MSNIAQGSVGNELDKIANEVKELRHSVAKILELLRPPKKKTEKWIVDYNLESTTVTDVYKNDEVKT
tara:strand:- start:824 stop:1024 length:201 start_codon:yes stop_codon:yes gene_type:complete